MSKEQSKYVLYLEWKDSSRQLVGEYALRVEFGARIKMSPLSSGTYGLVVDQ